MLKDDFNHAFKHRTSDKTVADCVDKYLNFCFDEKSDHFLDGDHYDFIREEIFDAYKLGLYRAVHLRGPTSMMKY